MHLRSRSAKEIGEWHFWIIKNLNSMCIWTYPYDTGYVLRGLTTPFGTWCHVFPFFLWFVSPCHKIQWLMLSKSVLFCSTAQEKTSPAVLTRKIKWFFSPSHIQAGAQFRAPPPGVARLRAANIVQLRAHLRLMAKCLSRLRKTCPEFSLPNFRQITHF